MRDPMKYQRETPEPPVHRSQRIMLVCLITMALLELLGCWLFTQRAHAEGFVLTEPSCRPIPLLGKLMGVIDARLYEGGDADVGIWWCDTPGGIEENFRAGNAGRPIEEWFKQDFDLRNLAQLDRAAFFRAPNAKELEQAAKAEALYEPRCLVTSTGKTTQVLSAPDRVIGPALTQRYPTTQRPSCGDWIKVGTKLYCSVAGQGDTKGKPIEAGYVACKLTTAPAEGWP